jgi:hypothetical protein
MDPSWNFEQNFQWWDINENATFKVYDMDGSDASADLFGQTNVSIHHMLNVSCRDDSDEEFPFDCLHSYNLTTRDGKCVRGPDQKSPAAFNNGTAYCKVAQPNLNLAFKYSKTMTDAVPADNKAYKRIDNLLMLEDDENDEVKADPSNYLWAAPFAVLGVAFATYSLKNVKNKDTFVMQREI